MFSNWNEKRLKHFLSIHWRASLVPAAAVIPAPIAYTKVVAVKKLVVEFLVVAIGQPLTGFVPGCCVHPRGEHIGHSVVWCGILVIYCEQNRVFKAGLGR